MNPALLVYQFMHKYLFDLIVCPNHSLVEWEEGVFKCYWKFADSPNMHTLPPWGAYFFNPSSLDTPGMGDGANFEAVHLFVNPQPAPPPMGRQGEGVGQWI